MNLPLADRFAIRSATNQDGERIRSLVFSVLAEVGFGPDRVGKDADLFDVEELYLAPGGMIEGSPVLLVQAGGSDIHS